MKLLLLFLFLASPQDDIRAAVQASAAAWNRGDIDAYASFYDDSPATTFIGREVTRGGAKAIADRYKRSYPNREAMGTLDFSEVTVRMLGPDLAIVTGRWHLQRTAAGGGEASGRTTLIMRKGKSGWKIIHDHSS